MPVGSDVEAIASRQHDLVVDDDQTARELIAQRLFPPGQRTAPVPRMLDKLHSQVTAELCRREGIVQNLYYRWSKEFLEIARLKREVAKLKAERESKKSRGLLRERINVKFSFIAKHRGIWAVDWMCGALGVSRGGFYAWLTRSPPGVAERTKSLV